MGTCRSRDLEVEAAVGGTGASLVVLRPLDDERTVGGGDLTLRPRQVDRLRLDLPRRVAGVDRGGSDDRFGEDLRGPCAPCVGEAVEPVITFP